MTTTAVLVFQGHNQLRYLVTADETGGAVTIDNDGGASPDLTTDSIAGPIKEIATAKANGIGEIPAGDLTQAQARALLLADSAAADVGNSKVPRTRCFYTPRTAGATPTSIDANVATGAPVLTITPPVDSVGYVDIIAIGFDGSS